MYFVSKTDPHAATRMSVTFLIGESTFRYCKKAEENMREQAKRWLTDQMEQNHISAEVVANVLDIPVEKLLIGTDKVLEADEFLRVCAYLHFRPENIPID